MRKRLLLLLFSFSSAWYASAQENIAIARAYLLNEFPLLENNMDFGWIVTDEVTTQHNGVTHLYLRQSYKEREIVNANLVLALKSGNVIHMAGDPVITKPGKEKNSLTPQQAVQHAAAHLKIPVPSSLNQVQPKTIKEAQQDLDTILFEGGGVSKRHIPLKKIFFADANGNLKLAWGMSIEEINERNVWDMVLDASTGEVLSKNNRVAHCNFESAHSSQTEMRKISHTLGNRSALINSDAQYAVFQLPLHNPDDGPYSITQAPLDLEASPFGWHDVNGQNGADYTITRGNNVYAYEDIDHDNLPGYSPDGTASLLFDFPFDINASHSDNQDAALTNLFYTTNLLHDIFYHYGFNEAAGNFQVNNYGKGGLGNDALNAQGLDGSGKNNAYMTTYPDGQPPRMEMYLFDVLDSIQINSLSLNGTIPVGSAVFDADLNQDLIGELVFAEDGVAPISDACTNITNDVAGKVVLIDRGSCSFVFKAQMAQDAGAIAVIIVDNVVAETPIELGGTGAVLIQARSVTKAAGDLLKTALASNTVSVTIKANKFRDSSFDNVLISHEYGHGISYRLVGGPSVICLGNAETMNEGWSDYFALMVTMKSTDQNVTPRTIASFSTQDPDGFRKAPYTTNMAVNNFTYADLPANTQTHALGHIWATMLWDMTWKFIDRYGFNPDVKHGTGGNNKALQLVIDALKLTPCAPGFVDGRNAILAADIINNQGANQDIIWSAFANRGLGLTATQGSTNVLTDGVAAFDLPASQLISFSALPAKTFGDAPFVLSATGGNSGNAVTFESSNPAVATVSGAVVTIVGAGTTTITARQAGTFSYFTAQNVQRTLVVNKASQTIAFEPLPSKFFGDGAFNLTATGGASGNEIVFTSTNTAVATISGNQITIVGAGTTTITAAQNGNDNYNGAVSVPQTLNVNKANQTILFKALPSLTFGDPPFNLNASGGNSGAAIIYTSSNQTVATISGNTLNIVGAGTAIISALQAGNNNYNEANTVEQILTVNKALQTISFGVIDTKTLGENVFNLSGTSTAGLAITYFTTSPNIRVDGNAVTLLAAGMATITATQPGDANYVAATLVNQSFCVNPPRPTITASFGVDGSAKLTSSSTAGNQWFFDGTIIAAEGNIINVNQSGVYNLQVTSDNCVSELSEDFEVVITALANAEQDGINFYPNPVGETLLLDVAEKDLKVAQLFSVDGKLLKEIHFEENHHELSMKDYRAGLYFLLVKSVKRTFACKFTKQ